MKTSEFLKSGLSFEPQFLSELEIKFNVGWNEEDRKTRTR